MSRLLSQKLDFPITSDRPFFFTSYVSTIDGKIYVKKPGYWPIGSKTDYDFFTFLRAHADVIVEGKNTALAFGDKTIQTIHSEKFLSYRKQLGKENPIEYMVLTRGADERLARILENPYGFKPTIITSSDSKVASGIKIIAHVSYLNDTPEGIDLHAFTDFLIKKKLQLIFLDTGPTLFGSFLGEGLVDDVFLTIAPKIFGSSDETMTLGDNYLFSPQAVPQFALISSEQVENELFLHYRNDKK